MSGPWILVQFFEAFTNSGPYRIEMNITDQLADIVLVLSYYGLVPLPEQGAIAFIFSLVIERIAGVKRPHQFPQFVITRSDDKVKVIGHKCPSIAAISRIAQTT